MCQPLEKIARGEESPCRENLRRDFPENASVIHRPAWQAITEMDGTEHLITTARPWQISGT